MAGGEVWCEIAPDVAQAASGGDAVNGMIVARTLTDQDADNPSQVGPLPDQVDDPIIQVTADGAYDGAPTYQTIAARDDEIEVVIPPRSTTSQAANRVRRRSVIAI